MFPSLISIPKAVPGAGGCAAFASPRLGMDALLGPLSSHRQGVIRGAGSRATPGSWKTFHCDGNLVLSLVLFSVTVTRTYTDQQKVISEAQINYRDRRASINVTEMGLLFPSLSKASSENQGAARSKA